jgi:hypothetical protein
MTLLVLLLAGLIWPSIGVTRWQITTNCALQVQLARQLLKQAGVDWSANNVMRERLAVPILHLYTLTDEQPSMAEADATKLRHLKRAIDSLTTNLMNSTKADVFIFSFERHIKQGLASWLNRTNVYILPINDLAISIPHHLLRPREMMW